MPSMEILSILALNVVLKPHKKVVLTVTQSVFIMARKRNVHIVKLRSSVWTSTSGTNTQSITKCMLATNAATDPSISLCYKSI